MIFIPAVGWRYASGGCHGYMYIDSATHGFFESIILRSRCNVQMMLLIGSINAMKAVLDSIHVGKEGK